MTDVRQCWALNKNLQRCDMPAGHPGDHAIQTTWTDNDCYNPEADQPIPYTPTTNPGKATAPATLVAHIEPKPEPKPEPCVACRHFHKDGECKCGCYSFVG